MQSTIMQSKFTKLYVLITLCKASSQKSMYLYMLAMNNWKFKLKNKTVPFIITDIHFQPRWNNRKAIYFTCIPETIKNGQNIRNESFQANRHHVKYSDSWLMENKWSKPYNHFFLRPWESLQAVVKGEGTQAEPGGLPELKRWS